MEKCCHNHVLRHNSAAQSAVYLVEAGQVDNWTKKETQQQNENLNLSFSNVLAWSFCLLKETNCDWYQRFYWKQTSSRELENSSSTVECYPTWNLLTTQVQVYYTDFLTSTFTEIIPNKLSVALRGTTSRSKQAAYVLSFH